MFLATVRTVIEAPFNKHHVAASRNFKTITSPARYHFWPQRNHSRRCTNVIHSRTITIPKVPSLLRLFLKAKIGPDAKGGRHIDAVTRNRCIGVSSRSCHTSSGVSPELEALYDGNRLFRDSIADTNPHLLKILAEQGQRPPFMFLTCSDSRVCAKTIFSTKPGTIFTTANIANQYNEHDLNANSALSFAVNALGVHHIVVMGHYGCGGVEAAFKLSRVNIPTDATTSIYADHTEDPVCKWITPIRQIYEVSMRKEIVEHRQPKRSNENGSPLHIHDPAFRALVEENVKANVHRIAESNFITIRNRTLSSVINQKQTRPVEIFVHGWVYDIATGEVMDLGVSVGPPGMETPRMPFKRLTG